MFFGKNNHRWSKKNDTTIIMITQTPSTDLTRYAAIPHVVCSLGNDHRWQQDTSAAGAQCHRRPGSELAEGTAAGKSVKKTRHIDENGTCEKRVCPLQTLVGIVPFFRAFSTQVTEGADEWTRGAPHFVVLFSFFLFSYRFSLIFFFLFLPILIFFRK